jgi:hypothetical protein
MHVLLETEEERKETGVRCVFVFWSGASSCVSSAVLFSSARAFAPRAYEATMLMLALAYTATQHVVAKLRTAGVVLCSSTFL